MRNVSVIMLVMSLFFVSAVAVAFGVQATAIAAIKDIVISPFRVLLFMISPNSELYFRFLHYLLELSQCHQLAK